MDAPKKKFFRNVLKAINELSDGGNPHISIAQKDIVMQVMWQMRNQVPTRDPKEVIHSVLNTLCDQHIIERDGESYFTCNDSYVKQDHPYSTHSQSNLTHDEATSVNASKKENNTAPPNDSQVTLAGSETIVASGASDVECKAPEIASNTILNNIQADQSSKKDSENSHYALGLWCVSQADSPTEYPASEDGSFQSLQLSNISFMESNYEETYTLDSETWTDSSTIENEENEYTDSSTDEND